MPNHHCCVPGCSADSRKDTSLDKYKFLQGVTFHAFPREPEIKDLWLKLMQRPDYIPNRYSRVCSLHFADKLGPTANNPCPTVFAYNGFSKEVPQELIPQVAEVSARFHQRESLRTPRVVVLDPRNQAAISNPHRTMTMTPPKVMMAQTHRVLTTQVATEPKLKVARMDSPHGAVSVDVQRNKEVAEARREVMSIADRRRHQQEELKRVQAEIVAKAAANAQLLASIHEAERSGQIQLIDEADIKAIQDAAAAGEDPSDSDLNNPYRFINENTDMMWDVTSVPDNVRSSGQVIKKVEGEEGGWEVLPDTPASMPTATTTTTTPTPTPTAAVRAPATPTAGGKKRRHEEVDPDIERDPEEDPEEDDEDDEESSSEDEEDEDSGEGGQGIPDKKKTEPLKDDDLMAVVAKAEALEEELTEQMMRPPLLNETSDITRLRERLTLRGPHHNYLPKPRCKFCNLFFQSIDSLLGHLYRHTDRPYQCVECGATFRKAEELETHIEVHLHREAETSHYYKVLGTKHGILECPVEGCSWHSGGWIRVFAAHIRQHNKGCCVLCGEGVHGSSEPFFMKHIKKHMSWTSRLKCPLCPQSKQALPRKTLESHVKSQHASEIKPWACYHCDNHKVIPKFHDLDLHLLKVHSSNPYECQYCGAAYPSLYGLRCHARKHHKRGKEHDTKYEWVEVVHKQNATKDTKLPSTRKSNQYQKISMMPQTGDRQMHNQSQLGSVMSLFTSPLPKSASSSPALLNTDKSLPGNILTIPQVKSHMQTVKIPTGHSPSRLPGTVTMGSPGVGSAGSQQHYMRKYKPQKVMVMQKDGTAVEKTLLLPVEEGQRVGQGPTGAVTQVVGSAGHSASVKSSPTIMKVPMPPGFKLGSPGSIPLPPGFRLASPGGGTMQLASPDGGIVRLASPGGGAMRGMVPAGMKIVQQHPRTPPKPAPTIKQPSTSSKPLPSSSTGIPQLSLADLASGNIPGGLDIVDESILESLGISSQDLEQLGPATESDENLGFTITEVRGDIDFGALPDDGNSTEGELEAKGVVPSLMEDKEDKAVTRVRCPYKSCNESYDTAIGFWRNHYLKNHFKRSDLYEFMCRDCGELFANWDWPPEAHDCNKPRWACICADCGDIFENQRFKSAHFPDCITFQKYTPAKAATVITACTCLYCHTTLKSVAELCNHLRVAHVSRRFNSLSIYCSHCEDYPTFPKPDALWNHYKTKHLDWWKKQLTWVCTKCGETHETEYDLTKHAVYTHAEEVTPQFFCNQCPYVFGQRCLFDMHKQIAHKD